MQDQVTKISHQRDTIVKKLSDPYVKVEEAGKDLIIVLETEMDIMTNFYMSRE
jgi:hypothetical protein